MDVPFDDLVSAGGGNTTGGGSGIGNIKQRFNASLIADALGQLLQSIHHRAGFLNVYQSVVDCSEPDIR